MPLGVSGWQRAEGKKEGESSGGLQSSQKKLGKFSMLKKKKSRIQIYIFKKPENICYLQLRSLARGIFVIIILEITHIHEWNSEDQKNPITVHMEYKIFTCLEKRPCFSHFSQNSFLCLWKTTHIKTQCFNIIGLGVKTRFKSQLHDLLHVKVWSAKSLVKLKVNP